MPDCYKEKVESFTPDAIGFMSSNPSPPALLHYRPAESRRRGPWSAALAVARSALLLIARRKLFWMMYAICVLIFLFYFFGQYLQVFLENRVAEQTVRTGGVFGRTIRPDFFVRALRDALHMDGSADTYGDIMWTEGYIVVVLLAFAGSVLVGSDFQHNSLPFYLSKPMSRRHYLAGKCLAVALLINVSTTLPAIGLYIEYGFIETWEYYWDARRLLFGILAYGAAMTVVLSMMLMVTAAWLRRTVPMIMVWTAFFVMARMVQRWLVDGLNLSVRWRLIDVWNDLYLFGQWCFGTPHRTLRPTNQVQPAYWEAAVVLFGVVLVCAWQLRKRVRAVEVVT